MHFSRYIFYILVFGSFFLSSKPTVAQECDGDVSDKSIKLVEKAKDRKKYTKPKRLQFLRLALENDPDYAEANYLLAIETIKTQRAKGGGYSTVIKYLEKVKYLCPDFHSDVYYYLGSIYLGRKDYKKALENEQLFLDFTSDIDTKFSKHYEKQIEQTKEDTIYSKFYTEAYSNPVPFLPKVVSRVSTNHADEYLPLITPDNEKLFFTRRWQDTSIDRTTAVNTSDEISYVEKFSTATLKNGEFSEGSPMPPPFNIDKKSNYGGATISINNRHLYITVCKPYFNRERQAYLYNCDIYQSDYTFGLNKKNMQEEWYWTEPENCGPNINTPTGWESQPSLSADGKQLYFASIREGSEGIDIYKSDRGEDGWQPAENLGKPINTEFNDKSPFIHTDSKTLYFSSQGHIGFGGFDIFYTRQNEDGTWNEPKNMSHPINTDEDEHGFIVSTSGEKVYYSSARIGNIRTKLNILSFDLYKEARPDNVVLIKGKIDESELAEDVDVKVKIEYLNAKKITEFDVEKSDGAYAAVVVGVPKEKVLVKVQGKDIAYNVRLVELPDTQLTNNPTQPNPTQPIGPTNSTKEIKPIGLELNLVAKTEKIGENYLLEDIYYETNSSEISEKSRVVLDDFGNYMLKNKNVKVAIHGHTDNVGQEYENKVLSTDRAYAVKRHLEKMGIESYRLKFEGFGSLRPIANNKTEKGRKLNRRTEFVLLSK